MQQLLWFCSQFSSNDKQCLSETWLVQVFGAWFRINFIWKIFEAPVLKPNILLEQHWVFFIIIIFLIWDGSTCFLKHDYDSLWYFLNYVPWDISFARCPEKWERGGQIRLLPTCAHFGKTTLHVSSLKALRSLGVKGESERHSSIWYDNLEFQTITFSRNLSRSKPGGQFCLYLLLLWPTCVEMRWHFIQARIINSFSASVIEY